MKGASVYLDQKKFHGGVADLCATPYTHSLRRLEENKGAVSKHKGTLLEQQTSEELPNR